MTPATKTKPAPREAGPPEPAPSRIAYRIAEFAALIGVSTASIYRGVNNGSLISRKFNGVTLILGFGSQDAAVKKGAAFTATRQAAVKAAAERRRASQAAE